MKRLSDDARYDLAMGALLLLMLGLAFFNGYLLGRLGQ